MQDFYMTVKKCQKTLAEILQHFNFNVNHTLNKIADYITKRKTNKILTYFWNFELNSEKAAIIF